MEVVEAVEDLGHDVFGLALRQVLCLLEVGVQIAVGAVLQPEDYVVLCLKSIQQIYEILVFYCKQNVLLVLEHFYLLCSSYGVLPYELQCAVLVVQPAFCEIHLRETTTPQKLNYLEI